MKQAYFCLSAKTRKKLYAGIRVVSAVSAVFCALYLGMVLHSFYRHRFLLHDLIISLFDDLYKNLIVLGVLIFLLSVLSFKLNKNLKNQPTNHSLPRTHRVWVGLSLATLVLTAFCTSLMSRVEAVVNVEVGPRLKHGLSRYIETPSWGSALDRIQSYLQCCGVHGPSDWYATAWIPLDRLTGHNVDYKLVQPNGRVQVPLVPTSCCRLVSAECGHRAWMETKTRSWGDIKPADISLLYAVGCEEAIKSTVGRDFLIFKVLLLVVFILQVALVAAARLLYSSTINSVMLGRPGDKAPGWLVGPRLFRGKKRYGYLQEYDDRCQHIESGENQEDSSSHKTKWKCINRIRCRKSKKGSDTEGTQQSSEGGKRRFKSPCLAKLKGTKCITKLKASCSRRFGKKKYIEGEYTAIEAESDSSPEREGMKSHNSDQNMEDRYVERSSHVSENKKISTRMRTGSDEQQYRHRVHTDTRHGSFETGRTSVKKKISENLIDVEDVFEQKHQRLELFEMRANTLSPTSAKYSVGLQSQHSKSSTPDVKITSCTKSIVEPRKHLSGVVKDFKKRRELFENAAKAESQIHSSKAGSVHIAIPPPIPQSLNLIDLDAVESVRSLSVGGTSATTTIVSSNKNEPKPPPLVLRNYPPLSPLEKTGL